MRIGRYVVEGKLGEGGMAETWLCRMNGAKGFSKRVVIKTLKPDCRDRESQVMFADEARIGSKLEHPNIPRVLEFGEIAEVPYLVQEYVEGPNLHHLFRRQKLVRTFDLRLGCRIVSDIARALHYAFHAVDDEGRPLHVVHRDVSPSNILVSKRGPSKLIDFGVSTFEDRETHTRAGVLKGKLRYMAPEVLMRDEVTHRSDLYSLGIVLYALCTGEPPWSGVDEVPDRLRGALVPPSARRAEVDGLLEEIVVRCLAHDPSRRFQTGDDLADALDAWLEANGGPVSDDTVAERVAALFPDGPKDWVSGFDLTALSAIGSRPRAQPAGASPRNPWVYVLAGAVALLVVSLLALVTATGAAVYLWPRPGPPAVAAAAPDPNQSARELLDSAEIAIARGEPSEAASHLRAFGGLPVSDPALLSRKERLTAELQVANRVATTRDLLPVDPALALSNAVALDAEYPGEPAVAALLADARAAVAAPEAPDPQPSPKPSPTAPRAPALVALRVEGSPSGAEVRVDGVGIGRLPIAVELPPGPHAIEVSATGFSTHRDELELGSARSLTVTLQPAALESGASARPTGLQDPFGAGAKPQGLQDPFGGNP